VRSDPVVSLPVALRQHTRLQQRIAADKASINGISILPAERTIEHGKRLIEFRTDATVEAIHRVLMAARGG